MFQKGFTVLEIIFITLVFFIITATAYFILDPYELKKRGDDSLRLSDLATLQQAINTVSNEASGSGKSIFCTGLSTPCKSDSNSNNAEIRKPNGSGWVKVDLSSQKDAGVPILPQDPVNDDKFHYSFASDGTSWEIDVPLDSSFFKAKMSTDGGNNDNVYEVGTNLTLIN